MADIDKILPVTQVKRNLLKIITDIVNDESTISVTKNGEPVSVMMTHRRYEALLETIEVLADKNVLVSLARSSNDFKAGRVYNEDEVWKD